jgi:hypothetical protein
MKMTMTKSPLTSIRRFCVDCQGGSFEAVINCTDLICPFYEYRYGDKLPTGRHSPVKACKTYCHAYCNPGGPDEVRNCQGDKAEFHPCPVYPFRMGRNPNKQKPLSEERRLALVEMGKKYAFKPGAKAPFQPPKSNETARHGQSIIL